jgi:hypothetical protein
VPRICSPSVKKMGANLLAIVANRQRALEGMVSSRKHRCASAAPNLTSICMPGLLLVCPTARGPQAQAPGLDRANVRPCHEPPPPSLGSFANIVPYIRFAQEEVKDEQVVCRICEEVVTLAHMVVHSEECTYIRECAIKAFESDKQMNEVSFRHFRRFLSAFALFLTRCS